MIVDPMRQRERIVLDTNILLVLIGYAWLTPVMRALDRARALSRIRGQEESVSPEVFDRLWQLFRTASRRIVTQHVVAETYNLRKLLPSRPSQERPIWHGAVAFLLDSQIAIEEQSCAVRDLQKESSKILDELGPCDTGLIFTAEREKATIVTDDGPLERWARVRRVPVITFETIGENHFH